MRSNQIIAAIACAIASIGAASAATPENPAVVEAFTSQGCSTCPPMDANIRILADRPDVLALTYSVTYWDKLGWQDTFGQEWFTTRQRNYEKPLHERSMFTPQVVVDGRMDTIGNNRADLERLIAASNRSGTPGMHLAPGIVAVDAGTGNADVWLVRYDPRTVSVAVSRGENSGATLLERNVVHSLINLGRWDGTAAQYKIPAAEEPGLKTAVLLQKPDGGEIIGAARD